MLGFSIGPPVTAFLTDVIFQDEGKVGYSLAIVSGVSLPLSFLCLRFALRALGLALRRAASA